MCESWRALAPGDVGPTEIESSKLPVHCREAKPTWLDLGIESIVEKDVLPLREMATEPVDAGSWFIFDGAAPVCIQPSE